MGHFDKHFLTFLSVSALVMGMSMGCSHKETRAEKTASDAYTTQPAVTSEATPDADGNMRVSGVIEFDRGQFLLSAASQEKLRWMVSQARAAGDIDKVRVAAWSDREFPGQGRSLSKVDRDLASRRADHINDYLKDALDVRNVDKFNMAEQSNWLARLFNTDDAELKSVFAKQGAPAISDEDLRIFKDNGAAGHAVILIRRDLR